MNDQHLVRYSLESLIGAAGIYAAEKGMQLSQYLYNWSDQLEFHNSMFSTPGYTASVATGVGSVMLGISSAFMIGRVLHNTLRSEMKR